MAGEKNFENRLKRWLESIGVYPLGQPLDKMPVPPCGYYEKRWGGGRYQKSGLPDMRIVVNGIALEVELKAPGGTLSELQKHNIRQINSAGGMGFILYPEGFETFKDIVKGVIAWAVDALIAGLIVSTVARSNTKCAMLSGSAPSRTLTRIMP